jgi:16S rRNA C967 or C1407 C5-methylase (RsmB/RsmF family)
MDASSGVAVLALDVQPNMNVLDLCAAPGTKMMMIADLMKVSYVL